ncbi:hypothetical protein GCM10017788_77710 [Amycolatopsis acidiphila]|nr:hypothetical protein GCM10017788_77710 [Amycolatopsis acidiphila]
MLPMPARIAPQHESAASVLARRIRARRAELGLTVEQLAFRSGLSVRYIASLEARDVTSPGLQPLLQIAQALQLESGDFLGGLAPNSAASPPDSKPHK